MSGDGPEHIVEEWQTDESFVPNMLRPAALLDAMVRHHNWKSTHPFHYHSGDYVYPDESQNGELASVEFARGRFDRSYREIYPRKVRIDFRYKDVDYYDNASIIALLEDGSVVLTDGYGSRIFMGGGQIRLEATGDCMLSAGGRVTVMGKEVVVRGKDHVDLSASDGELRLKSERNMQLLAANSGTGGLLLESKGQGVRQDYKNKIGEEVQASGIMLLAKGGSLTTASQTAYFRTGVMEGNAEGMGDFVIDVANGRSAMTWYASFVSLFSQQGMGIWYPPVGQGDPQIEDATYFGPDYSQLNGALTVRGNATLVDGGTLAVARDIYSGGNIIATQYVAAAGGLEGIADSSQNDLPAAIQNYIRVYEEFADRVEESGRPIFEAVFTRGWWPERMPGNNDLLANQIGFSYRDKSRTGRAYGYTEDGFQFLETWWQMLGRRGLVEAGEAWTEKPVQYQGEKLYPWPGRVNWVENDRLVAYDTAAGSELFEGLAAASRTTKQTDYERPTYGRWSRQACDGNYKL
jgi:hypothetical protein